MSINLVEEKITIFFEVIEVIMDFNWKDGSKNLTRLEQLNIAYEDFSPLKTMANLDSNRKIRGTPIHQLYDFLTSVYEFVRSLLSKIHRQLLKIYQELNTDMFDILTTPLRLQNCLDTLQAIQQGFPDIDYTFSRYFYHQILPKWLSIETSMFDPFLTEAQKMRETIPNLLILFQHSVLETLVKNDELPSSVTPALDKLEGLMGILPEPFSQFLKTILVKYLSLVTTS